MTPQGFLGYDKSDTIVPHNTKCLSVTETSVAIVTTSWDYSHLKTMLLLTRNLLSRYKHFLLPVLPKRGFPAEL